MGQTKAIEMQSDSKIKKFIRQIDISSISHPEDISTKAKLDSIPGFKTFMTDVICPIREKMIGIEYAGNGIKVSSRTMPRLDNLLQQACEILGIQEKPSLSLMWMYVVAAATEGVKKPHITASSGAIDLLDENEQMFILGHELGHQISGHKPYHMFLESMFLPIIETIPGGKQWMALVKSTLFQWYRVSDYTADRIGLLACQDINVALSVIVKMAGLPKKYYNSINVSAFIQQAKEFDNMTNSLLESGIRDFLLRAESHPWNVSRAAQLIKWYQSGEYDNFIQNS